MRPTFWRLPDFVSGIPICRDSLPLAAESPEARFQENDVPNFLRRAINDFTRKERPLRLAKWCGKRGSNKRSRSTADKSALPRERPTHSCRGSRGIFDFLVQATTSKCLYGLHGRRLVVHFY